MERRLIPILDQLALRAASGTSFDAELERIRLDTSAPASWRLDPDYKSFYNPTGMAQGEIDAYEATELTSHAQTTSRQKDTLATLAVIVRAKNTIAWNAMTTAQKVAATLAEADVWKTIREFIDDKV